MGRKVYLDLSLLFVFECVECVFLLCKLVSMSFSALQGKSLDKRVFIKILSVGPKFYCCIKVLTEGNLCPRNFVR